MVLTKAPISESKAFVAFKFEPTAAAHDEIGAIIQIGAAVASII